jgi:hypothetical protein
MAKNDVLGRMIEDLAVTAGSAKGGWSIYAGRVLNGGGDWCGMRQPIRSASRPQHIQLDPHRES